MKTFPTTLEEIRSDLNDLIYNYATPGRQCFEIVLPNGHSIDSSHIDAYLSHGTIEDAGGHEALADAYFKSFMPEWEDALSHTEETVYLQRGSDCSNDNDENDPDLRWLWLDIWTDSDPDRRYIRYDWSFEMECWELGCDDFPAMSNKLLDVFNRVVDDDLLTAYYRRREGRVRITADGLEA